MFSIIICSIDDDKFADVSENYQAVFAGEEFEIIRMKNAKSMASGYNEGMSQAKGDILIFSHDDIEIVSPDVPATLRRALHSFDVVGVVGTTKLISPAWILAAHPYVFGQVIQDPHIPDPAYVLHVFGVPTREVGNIQAIDGLFMAVRRSVFSQIQFDETTFDAFHLYDVDFSYACYRAGLKVGVACDLHLIHGSGGNFDDKWRVYAERFAAKYPEQDWTAPMPPYKCTLISLGNRSRFAELMTPPYWTS